MEDFLEGLFSLLGFVVVVAIIIHGYFLVRYDTVDPCAVTLHRAIAYYAGETKANELTGFEKAQLLEVMKKELKSNEKSWMYCYKSAIFPMDKVIKDHQ